MRKLTVALGLLASCAIARPALAEPSSSHYARCDKTVSSNESELAHQKYIAGKQDYDEGNYVSAVRRFRDAYTLDCTKHELLIIISAAYEREGDKREALNALETYVERAPSAPDVATYRAKIENVKKQIAAARPAPIHSSSSAARVPAEHSIYPWFLVGAGAVTLGVGITMVATTPSLPGGCDETTKQCVRRQDESAGDFENRRVAAGRSVAQPIWGTVATASGVALVAGGLLWHFLEPRQKKPTKAKLTPTVAPGVAGLALGGTF